MNAKNNIYINSYLDYKDVSPINNKLFRKVRVETVNFDSDKTSELTSKGTLTFISQNNQNLQNTKLTGGAVLLESGGKLNTPKGIEINATGSDLLKNDAQLNALNGDLSIQTQSSFTINPSIYHLNAEGDIQLTSKQGVLTLEGSGSIAGNTSGNVFNLKTNNGSIGLQGESIDIQGSQLNASKDITMVATNGNIKIDGVKNTINNSNSIYVVNDLTNQKENIKKQIDNLNSNQEYIAKKNDLTNRLVEERKKAKPISVGRLREYCPSRCKIAQENVILLENEYNALIQKENNLNSNISVIDQSINYFNTSLNGSEHTESSIISTNGNIALTSNKGISISGANISANTGQVNIEAQGALDQTYTSTTQKGMGGQTTQMGASIIIDGHNNFYDKGNENDENYSMRTLISPSIINGDQGVTIRTTGQGSQDNLVLQATGVTSPNGDIRIESNKNVLFDAAIEQSYDRSTSTEKKKSWGG